MLHSTKYKCVTLDFSVYELHNTISYIFIVYEHYLNNNLAALRIRYKVHAHWRLKKKSVSETQQKSGSSQ